MSEPGVYGGGIIGIVSFRLDSRVLLNPAVLEQRQTTVINPPLRPTCLAAAIYGNLAFTCCEMGEQTGSASETKRPPLGPQGSGSLNGFMAPMYKIGRLPQILS
jgi:hypothetical protein